VLIIGAGPAGLTAAYILAKSHVPVHVIEADANYVGGISRTVRYKGFHFDIGGHRFFSKSTEVEDFWNEILPNDMLIRPRSSRIYYRGNFYSYPLRPVEAFQKLGFLESLICGLSYLRARLFPVANPANFEDWVSNQFGKRLFSIFFKTYTEKVWGMNCREISADWAAQRIKGLSLASAVASALIRRRPKGDVIKTLITSFRYPRKGPGMMWEACAARVTEMGGKVEMGARVTRCEWDERESRWRVTFRDAGGEERQLSGEHVISSAPIRELGKMLAPPLSERAARAAESLRYRDFLTVVLILEEHEAFSENWIYVHDPGVKVGRIQNFKSWSPEMVPDPAYACYGMEYFCFEGDGLWSAEDKNLIELAKRELAVLGLAEPRDIVDGCVVRQPKAYPVYDEEYVSHVEAIRAEIEARFPTLHLVGRNGMHKYNNQDHSMMTAMLCAKNILAAERVYDLWKVNQDAEYHEEGERAASTSGLRDVPTRSPVGDDLPRMMNAWRFVGRAALLFGVFALIFSLVMSLAMDKGLSHDEGQHIAAGALLSDENLLPYRDFPFFHTPYLVFIYGLLFEFTSQFLLPARLFSVACSALTATCIFAVANRVFKTSGSALRLAIVTAAVVGLVSSPLFIRTAGFAWNQDPSVLLALLALLAYLGACRRDYRGRWLFASGLFLGIAIGTRLTVAPLAAPFLGLLAVSFGNGSERVNRCAMFGAGVTAGSLPMLALFLMAPEGFLFGTLEFSKVNIAYRYATGEPRTMTALTKFRYFIKEIVRPNWPLVLAFATMLTALKLWRPGQRLPQELRVILWLLPFVLAGSFAPSPLFEQYFYAVVPFVLLGIIFGLGALQERPEIFKPVAAACGVMALAGGALGFQQYNAIDKLFSPSRWTSSEIRQTANQLRELAGEGDVLTLSPVYPIEAGMEIYPSFATGSFGWRVAAFVSPAKRERLGMVSERELETLTRKDWPEAILTGGKGRRWEGPLVSYAKRHRFTLVTLSDKQQLWISPGLPRRKP